MKNWKDYRNFRKQENPDGSFTYTIAVDGVAVEVSEDIYTAYAQGGYKMENTEIGLKCDRIARDSAGKAKKDKHGQTVVLPEREVSLDKLIADDWDFEGAEPSPEELVITSEFSESGELFRCLELLTEDERALIKALFYEGLTESEYAAKLGIRQQNVNKRKLRILKKIKSFWGQGC